MNKFSISVIVFSFSSVLGMQSEILYKEESFINTKKARELTNSNSGKSDTAISDEEESSDDGSFIQDGSINAICDLLIDEANASMVPTVCNLINCLINKGIPPSNPNLLFFRGVILYNSDFLSKVPASYLAILTENKDVISKKDFGLNLIKEAAALGCLEATEYLNNLI